MKTFLFALLLCALSAVAMVGLADAPDCTPSKGNDCLVVIK